MLVEEYNLDVETIPCEPGAAKFAATVRLNVDISPVLPYLNRTLRGAIYTSAPSLGWKKDKRNIAFWPFKISIGDLADRAEAERVAREIVDLVNSTWERREQIEPSYETRRRPTGLELYKFLPRTNCKACGEATCFVFANKLAVGQARLVDCTALEEPQYTEQRAKLAELLDVDLPTGVQRANS